MDKLNSTQAILSGWGHEHWLLHRLAFFFFPSCMWSKQWVYEDSLYYVYPGSQKKIVRSPYWYRKPHWHKTAISSSNFFFHEYTHTHKYHEQALAEPHRKLRFCTHTHQHPILCLMSKYHQCDDFPDNSARITSFDTKSRFTSLPSAPFPTACGNKSTTLGF